MTGFSKIVSLAAACAALVVLAIVAWPRVALLTDREARAAIDPAIPFYVSANSVNELFASAR